MLLVFYFCTLLTVCYNSCPLDKFGPNCEFKCNCLRNDQNCGEHGCQNDQCSYGFMDPPKCQTKCPKEKFGVNCMFNCNCPVNDSCNLVNGMCSSNKCKDGFGGAGCQKRIPFLSNPPVVEITTEDNILISWKPWPRSTQSTNTSLMVYSLQAMVKNKDGDENDSRHEWFTIATVKETYDLRNETWILEAIETFSAVLFSNNRSHHRMQVLYKNPEIERHYKFRILISLMKDDGTMSYLEPGPVTPKWHAVPCRAPTAVPKEVRVKKINLENMTAINISWETTIQDPPFCSILDCHEIVFLCQDCRHDNNSDDNDNTIFRVDNDSLTTGGGDDDAVISFNVTWPLTSLDIFNVSKNLIENDYKVMVRVMDRRGLVGPWSNAVSMFQNGSTTHGNETTDSNLTTRSQSSIFTPTPLTSSTSLSPLFDDPTETDEMIFVPQFVKLVERNSWNLKFLLYRPYANDCMATVYPSGYETFEISENDNETSFKMTIDRLLIGHYYNITFSCSNFLLDDPWRIATACHRSRQTTGPTVITRRSTSVVLWLPFFVENGTFSFIYKRDIRRYCKKLFYIVVERMSEESCCSLSHLVNTSEITTLDKRIDDDHDPRLYFYDYSDSVLHNLNFYKILTFDETTEMFGEFPLVNVGNGDIYDDYENPSLILNASYAFWFVIEQSIDGYIARSFSRSSIIQTDPDLYTESIISSSPVVIELSESSPSHSTTQSFSTASSLMFIRIIGQRERHIIRMLVIVIIIMSVIFILFGGFVWRWILRKKKESRLSNRLRNAKLMSRAYLNKEGFQLGATIKFPAEITPLESIFPVTNRSTNPFTFPPPFHAFTTPQGEDFVSPIPVKDLRSFCEKFVSPWGNDGNDEHHFGDDDRPSILKEFNSFPTGFTDVIVASYRPDIMESSQVSVVLPYEHNRVKLKNQSQDSNADPQLITIPGDMGIDESLNASRVRTLGDGSCIVTQTLTDQSCAALWQMIQQEAITYIIDLNSFNQSPSSNILCCYYPQMVKNREVYGDVEVELMSFETMAHYTTRVLWVGKGVDGRFVRQWNYHSWASNSTPTHHISFLDFLWRLSDEVTLGRDCSAVEACRALVHCNHGDGREGTFLALDALVTQGRKLGIVDVKSCVALLRSERHDIIKTFHQYSFIYECLAEVFDHSNSRKSILKFIGGFKNTNFKEPMKVPAEVAYEHKLMMSSSYRPLRTNNLNLDGFVSCGLRSSAIAGSHFEQTCLNFVSIDGLERRNAFFIQKQPGNWTDDVDFWRIIMKEKLKTIIVVEKMAAKKDGDANVLKLFTTESWNVGGFLVSCMGSEKMPSCSSHKLSIIRSSSGVDQRSIDLEDHLLVDVVQLEKSWGRSYEDSLRSLEAFVQFVHLLRTNEKWDHPMMLVGVGASKIHNKGETEASPNSNISGVGMFALLWSCVEQALVEGVVDVFERCRLLRSYLPCALNTKEEYYLVCLALSCYLGTYPDKLHRHHHHHKDTQDVTIHHKPSAKKRLNILSIPVLTSPYKISNPFKRATKRANTSTMRMDFSGSYQKFSSPHASPTLMGRFVSGSNSMTRRCEAKRPFLPRQHRFFDSIKRDEAPQMNQQTQL